MNNARRKLIANLVSALESQKDEAEYILGEEQEYFDNMPEGFQSSERGEAAESAISELETAISSIEEAISSLENIE